jgi:hypothetical protein
VQRPGNVAQRVDLAAQKQCNCSTMVRKIVAENMKLEKQVVDLEAVIQRMKFEKKTILRAHKREIGFVVYVVCALMIRGFV